ncbi:type VI secretion system baseplate subunit TssF [Paraburkholderia lycopersici]|uniref:Type VI secretion system protein ImpG n=1 Tax=Paraburkholderia lycopersici TaxID=416944 RepID=A0A1G7CVK3_9BURK|nr:type VI secretion system baseplate subunit TssF [Paraburkholderia lycopersici]SDE42770.1 type VI secretion system protein ImpG [Paraburkholderia lycopersici]
MDPRLLDYSSQALIYLRELAAGFGRQHPGIAARLCTQAGEVADPYVERLLESFCFMASRAQIKMDAEFPKFAERLLEVVYPNYVAPTPSMSVARIYPSPTEGNLKKGFHLPRGTILKARKPAGEKTACRFRTGLEVTLYPLGISGAKLTPVPSDVVGLDRYVAQDRQVRGALRVRLRTTNGVRISDLEGLDRLPVYLAGDEQVASHLFELLHVANVASLIGEPGQSGAAFKPLSVVTSSPVAHEGLGADQGLLPLTWSKFHGHNLLHEYFACPGRFHFFALTGLAEGFSRITGAEAEVVVLLDQPTDRLANLVDASRFALFCTPVINLFEKRTDQIEIAQDEVEIRLVPSKLEPLDYEVFAIQRICGQKTSSSAELEFRPLFQTLNNDGGGNYGRYFSSRRERRLVSDAGRLYGTRTPYVGTEVFVSLVDQTEAPYSEEIRYLSADAWVTNRDLPLLVPRNGVNDLNGNDEEAIESIGLIRPPSPPRPPYAEREMAWRLIRQLNFNYLPFSDMDHREGGQGLRDLLGLFLSGDENGCRRQVDALIGVKTQPVSSVLPGNGPLVFGRGIECILTVDEMGFSGVSPYLFGLVIEHYMARHVSINSFTQTELHSMQRGLVARWPVRMGSRGAAQ